MIGKHYLATLAAASVLVLGGCEQQESADAEAQAEGELASMQEKVSYIFGLNIARNFQQQDIELDPEALALALNDVYSDTPQRISDEEIQTVMETFQQEQMEKQQAAMEQAQQEQQQAAEENKQAGEEFLAQNAEKEGVVTLPSGLQ